MWLHSNPFFVGTREKTACPSGPLRFESAQKRCWRGMTSSGLSSRRPFCGHISVPLDQGVITLVLGSSDALEGLVGLLAVQRVAELEVPLESPVEIGDRRVAHVGRHLLTGLLVNPQARCVLTGGTYPSGRQDLYSLADTSSKSLVSGFRFSLTLTAERHRWKNVWSSLQSGMPAVQRRATCTLARM